MGLIERPRTPMISDQEFVKKAGRWEIITAGDASQSSMAIPTKANGLKARELAMAHRSGRHRETSTQGNGMTTKGQVKESTRNSMVPPTRASGQNTHAAEQGNQSPSTLASTTESGLKTLKKAVANSSGWMEGSMTGSGLMTIWRVSASL